MLNDRILVLCYLLAWIIAFVIHYKKRKQLDAGSFIMLSYIIYVFCSYRLLQYSYYFLPLKLFPFVYLFIMLLVGMWPVLKVRTSEGVPIQEPPIILINIFSLIFIISTLFLLFLLKFLQCIHLNLCCSIVFRFQRP